MLFGRQSINTSCAHGVNRREDSATQILRKDLNKHTFSGAETPGGGDQTPITSTLSPRKGLALQVTANSAPWLQRCCSTAVLLNSCG